MIPLDDPRWADLAHAYGAALDIPALLGVLASSPGPSTDPDDEPWFSLWSRLCHQGDVYTASYAALPHIVEIAMQATGPVDFGFFQLAAGIELARHEGRGPEMPPYLEEPYREAIAKLMDCVALHRQEDWDEAMLLCAITAQAVSKGHHAVARALFNLDSGIIDKVGRLDFSED